MYVYMCRCACIPFPLFLTVLLPRYVRVNLIKTNIIQVEEELISIGYELVSQEDFFCHHRLTHSPCETFCRKFCRDNHIPNLLAFCSGAPLTETKLYTSGCIVLQDKVYNVHVHVYFKFVESTCTCIIPYTRKILPILPICVVGKTFISESFKAFCSIHYFLELLV